MKKNHFYSQKILKMKKYINTIGALLFFTTSNFAQEQKKGEHIDDNKFSQMYNQMATPNYYRSASGAPGPAYYQQQADYKINISLDDKNSILSGEEIITYTNNSPDELTYLWLQLDQNIEAENSKSPLIENENLQPAQSSQGFVNNYLKNEKSGSYEIEWVKKTNGSVLPYFINQTMMRVELPKALKKGDKFSFQIKWKYQILNYMGKVNNSRNGYELFPDGNKIYAIAQFYPRMCVYSDVEGWQNMQFWGRSEFALPFGNYDVKITVPSDHIMEATGTQVNRNETFTVEQLKKWTLAENTFDKPVIIVTQEEALNREKGFATTNKTWHFTATNVRDFAFSTSRKFILDAMAVQIGNKKPLALSIYPKEANPLWGDLSTKAVAHTLKTYSKYTFDYPYPKAVSVSAEDQGMEYPMICWNFGRPDEKGFISDRVKYGMLGVIIHEVGHNFFPMIVNSDERQWTWMDEGLNTFLEYLAEIEFDKNFPVDRGPAELIVPYMKGNQNFLEPIMTQGDLVFNFGANAYGKPATGLNILRETIMGPQLFDYAFKTYAQRWMFKHPTPEDFFRTMEDASAMDLDWFWRGWFYSTDVNDLGIKNVKKYFVSEEPTKTAKELFNRRGRKIADAGPLVFLVANDSEDYKESLNKAFDKNEVASIHEYISKNLTTEEQKNLKNPKYFYEVEFEKIGGLSMPILLQIEFMDGSKENFYYPAEIWRRNNTSAKKIFATEKEIKKLQIDPELKTADVEKTNNTWPKQEEANKFDQLQKKMSNN